MAVAHCRKQISTAPAVAMLKQRGAAARVELLLSAQAAALMHMWAVTVSIVEMALVASPVLRCFAAKAALTQPLCSPSWKENTASAMKTVKAPVRRRGKSHTSPNFTQRKAPPSTTSWKSISE
ncbi:hypothetical protein BJ170DRAFT_679786 [Xylariales sp. AK1849]|nr:hypothetical protein BJ170DRAFT_679786 [Xylariales sp. AK1849]